MSLYLQGSERRQKAVGEPERAGVIPGGLVLPSGVRGSWGTWWCRDFLSRLEDPRAKPFVHHQRFHGPLGISWWEETSPGNVPRVQKRDGNA